MEAEPQWRQYEREVYLELVSKYPEAHIRHNTRLPGHMSRAERQIDVLFEEALHGETVITAVDAKHYARRIDVPHVEAFLGLLRDVQVDRGIMVSAKGYTKAAMARAFRDDVDLDLDVFSLEDFRQWQADCAIPYAGPNAVLLPAPFGWCVDAKQRPGAVAWLFRRGLTLQQAALHKEFIYVNLWNRVAPTDSLDALLAEQNAGIIAHTPDAVISVRDLMLRDGCRACVRRADVPSYPTAEITGFVELPGSIFFAVLFTPLEVERRNVRKLEYILKKVLPMRVRYGPTRP
jgi:hypothetical protein